jgi:Arc/MetJ-type ribon-helix-helix transcriptional regulator
LVAKITIELYIDYIYNTIMSKTTTISMSIPSELLKLIDQAAKKEFSTRSELIKRAALAYTRSLTQTGQLDVAGELQLALADNGYIGNTGITKLTKDIKLSRK